MMASRRRRWSVVLLCGWAALPTALSASGAENVDWSAATLVTVEMVDERFVPNKLSFRSGVPYHLRLENTGTAMHEFTAPEFFKAVTVKNPEALDPEQREAELQPKEHRDVYFVPQTPGRYALWCADHDWAGMTGDITIE